MDSQNNVLDVVVSSRVRLARNFKNIPFPAKLFDERAVEIQKKVFSAVEGLGDFSFYQISGMSENIKGVMLEKHLVSKALLGNKYSAVIISKNESISLMINEEDHIREQAFISGFNLKLAYSKINRIDDAIIQNCDIAFSNEFGFLTACPTNLGTGLRASCMLFLPALSINGKMEDVLKMVRAKKQTIRGFYGEGSEALGYLYQISNQTTLGRSELEIIEDVEKTIFEICALEIKERMSFYEKNNESLKNEAKSCLESLTSGKPISIKMFMHKSAIIKLYFCSNNNFKGKCEIFNHLISILQPCSLKELSGNSENGQDIDSIRGDYLRKVLKNVIQI